MPSPAISRWPVEQPIREHHIGGEARLPEGVEAVLASNCSTRIGAH